MKHSLLRLLPVVAIGGAVMSTPAFAVKRPDGGYNTVYAGLGAKSSALPGGPR